MGPWALEIIECAVRVEKSRTVARVDSRVSDLGMLVNKVCCHHLRCRNSFHGYYDCQGCKVVTCARRILG